MRFFLIYLIALFVSATAQAKIIQPLQVDFEGRWQNERGSEVVLSLGEDRVSGFYQTNVGQPDKSEKFPLTGFVQGDQITFSVNFGKYGSMTSWTGQLSEDSNGPYIRTLWHLTRDVPDDQEDADLWKSITAGASTFRPAAYITD